MFDKGEQKMRTMYETNRPSCLINKGKKKCRQCMEQIDRHV